MECKFVVGQKVAVKHPSKWPSGLKPCSDDTQISMDDTYTIRDIMSVDGEIGIRLVGVVRPPNRFGLEPLYYAVCFEAVVDKKTDISIFTKMLDPKNKFVEPREKEYAFNKFVISAYRLGSVDAALRRIKERIARMDGRRY